MREAARGVVSPYCSSCTTSCVSLARRRCSCVKITRIAAKYTTMSSGEYKPIHPIAGKRALAAIFNLTLEPQTLEPRAILAGGGLANIELGMARMAFIYAKQIKEYLNRLKVAGIDRAPRLTIPTEIPQDILAA